jgi:hypothetical protein
VPRRVVVEALRRRGHDGALTRLGDEPYRPYDLPTVSKQIWLPPREPSRAMLRDKQRTASGGLGVRLLLGRTATR